MTHLQAYVPTHGDSLRTTATHRDCLAVERMIDAKRSRACDLLPARRLEGLEPVPQEFHHRGLMIQVSKHTKLKAL